MTVMICICEGKSSWLREKFVLTYQEKVRQEKFSSGKTFVIKQNFSNTFLLIPLFLKKFVGESFCHLSKISSLLPDKFSDKVLLFFVCFYLFQRSINEINDKLASQLDDIFETRYF